MEKQIDIDNQEKLERLLGILTIEEQLELLKKATIAAKDSIEKDPEKFLQDKKYAQEFFEHADALIKHIDHMREKND